MLNPFLRIDMRNFQTLFTTLTTRSRFRFVLIRDDNDLKSISSSFAMVVERQRRMLGDTRTAVGVIIVIFYRQKSDHDAIYIVIDTRAIIITLYAHVVLRGKFNFAGIDSSVYGTVTFSRRRQIRGII